MSWIGLAVVLVVVGGYVVLGQAGAFGAAVIIALAVVAAARLRIPSGPSRPGSERSAGQENAAFRGYRRIESALTLAAMSRRHYDLGTRPMLARLLGALLLGRRRIDITHTPDGPTAARAAVGEELWPLLESAPPEWSRGPLGQDQPGVDQQTLGLIVDRLEEL